MQTRYRVTNPDGSVFWQPLFQFYWRCAHYPSALANFFRRDLCEHGCHKAELLWHDNGFHNQRGETR